MTMTRVLEWLLDLEAIRLDGGAPLTIRWQSAWPAWAILLAVGALVAWVWLIYRRDGRRRWGQWFGGLLRIALLLLILALLWQPLLLLQRTRVEPSQVVLLVDDSASMGTSDRYPRGEATDALARALGLWDAGSVGRPRNESPRPGTTSATATTTATSSAPSVGSGAVEALAGRSRAELLQAGLSGSAWSGLRALAERNRLAVYAFAGRARLQAAPAPSDALGPAEAWLSAFEPTGLQTDLAGAIDQVLSDARSGRLSAVVVASDGRSTTGGDLDDVVQAATESNVPIHAVIVGSPERRRDVIVGPAVADETVFVRDLLAVRVGVAATGFGQPVSLNVQLLGPDDAVLAQEPVTIGPSAGPAQVELRHRPDRPGRLRLRARVEPLPSETNPNNNVEPIEVQVVDEKVRVLYVDGYPRYEYRYLKNTLIREETVVVSCLLLSADEGFAQEGGEPIARFPETMEELEPFDVVIVGDVDPRGDWLSARQMETLVEWVGDRGGGFLMVAGPRWSPHAYVGTSLEKLIPVRIDPRLATQSDASLTSEFRPQLTVEGQRSSVFRFETDPNANERTVANLPGMFWHAQTQGPAPGVEVLAEHPTVRTVEGAMPLLVLGRYGAGSTGFAGIEETWRWRREVGGRLFDVYWLQLIRSLTRGQFLGRDRRFVLQTDRPRHALGDPVVLTLTVLDKAEATALPAELLVEIADRADRIVARVRLNRLGEGAATYEGTFAPPHPGSFMARLDASVVRPGQRPPSARIQVVSRGPELRQLEPDPDALRQLARRTGGLAVGLAELAQIAERIEDRSVEVPDDIGEPLWDTKLVLAVFVLIIGIEWIMRKALGLV